MELIIDAASPRASAGLSSRGSLVWTSGLLGLQEHTRELIPAIVNGLRESASTFSSLDAIVVSLGPGPFNGLRVAVSTAKGLAAGTGAAVVGISALEAEACRCEPSLSSIRPFLCAGRTGFTTALFEWRDFHWALVEDNRHVEAKDIADLASKRELICGDVAAVQAALGQTTSVLEGFRVAACLVSRLEILASLGWERYTCGQIDSPASLQPLYVRPPHITVAKDRRP